MPRAQVLVRDATVDDASSLTELWDDLKRGVDLTRVTHPDRVDVERAVARLGAEYSERLVVGVVEGDVVGMAHLRRAPIGPLHDEDGVHVTYLHVREGHRRCGVGRALLLEAAAWAEEKATEHLVVGVSPRARDSNRFLARLGFGQVATLRAATVTGLRLRLAAEQGAGRVEQVVVRRRRQRTRRRAAASGPTTR